MAQNTVLLIEAFYTGSHKQLIDLLHKEIPGTELVTLFGKKWHWKARTSALWLSQTIPREHNFKALFTSSVLNLAELVALRPDLAGLHKVLYFHENQLIYPVRKELERDFQFGYNQILSSLVADVVLFNSKHNLDSFLNNIDSHLKLIPDHRPKRIAEQIRPKCHVLHYPIVFPLSANLLGADTEEMLEGTVEAKGEQLDKEMNTYDDSDSEMCTGMNSAMGESDLSTDVGESCDKNKERLHDKVDSQKAEVSQTLITESLNSAKYHCDITEHSDIKGRDITRKYNMEYNIENRASNEYEATPLKKLKLVEYTEPLHIVWPHRWEHDKDPDTFFKVLIQLHNEGLDFRVSVLGEKYSEEPDVFEESKAILKEKVVHWGFLPSKQHYYRVLKSADCVVSTAKHEFFGVAMLEAVHLGCYPICPNQLVYPEIFPKQCLYNTEKQLFKKLREYCRKPYIVRHKEKLIETSQYSWDDLKHQFLKYIM